MFMLVKLLNYLVSILCWQLLAFIASNCYPYYAFGQNAPQEIYDGRREFKVVAPTLAEKQLVKSEVEKTEVRIKEKSGLSCDQRAFDVSSSANGSFTRPNSDQKAVLYELCRSGRNFGIGGIVIFENHEVAAHYIYGENGYSYGIKALPDIDQNGLSEILLIGSGTGQGYTEGGFEIIEFEARRVKNFGLAETYQDNFGTGNKPVQATAYKISFQSGVPPVFYREIYRQKGGGGKWTLIGKVQKFKLRKNLESKFDKID